MDLEERTARFAAAVRVFVGTLPRTIANVEDVKQLVRASGSVAANCIEANEALGPRDRLMKFGPAGKRPRNASSGSGCCRWMTRRRSPCANNWGERHTS